MTSPTASGPAAHDPAVAPQVTAMVVGPFQENCYLVVDPTTRAAALVDPGAEGPRLVEAVRRADVDLQAVWLTHAHLDHVGGLAEVKAAYDVPVHLHPLDLPVFAYAPRAAAMYGLPWTEQPTPDRTFAEGDVVALGALRFVAMHTPGHAPGHVVLHGHGIALAGDLLFQGSIGRTDLPGSDPRAMTASLERIAALPPATRVLPGHGPETTIARERAANPFLNGAARTLGG